MEYKIQFLKNVKDLIIKEIPNDTYLIYHEMYDPPIIPNITNIKFQDFKNKYFSLHVNKFIIIGLNRIITPSNRCQMVNDYMQTMTRNIPKIVVDTEPFIGEPWRVWYQFDVSNNDKFGLPQGYAMETEWKHWFYRNVNTCRLSSENIKLFLPPIYSDIDRLEFNIDYIESDDSYYIEAKEFVFAKYSTPKMLINNLLKLCNNHYKVNLSFDTYRNNNYIAVPDLPIYRFVGQENIERKNIYNEVIS